MAFTTIETIRIDWIGRKVTWLGEPNQWTIVDVRDGGGGLLDVDITFNLMQQTIHIALTKEFNLIMEFDTVHI